MIPFGLVQMSSQNDLKANLHVMESFCVEAFERKTEILVFPEMAYFMGSQSDWMPLLSHYDSLIATFAEWAKKYRLFLLPGSLREPVEGRPGKYFNTLPVLSPKGALLARYRKIFLFRANLPDRIYEEGLHCEAGSHVVTCDVTKAILGLSLCFDLRFPELFRALRYRESQIICLPSAFTVPTGSAHWETLLRSRAIENQCFVIAPAQTGKVGEGKETYGHSLAISPWGEVLLDLGIRPGLGIVEIQLDKMAESEGRVAAWSSRRDDIFPTG